MEIGVKKEKTLYNLFLKYLISFCILTVVLIGSMLFIFGIGVNTGIWFPANYAQNKLEKVKKEITDGDLINEKEIPHPFKYGYYNNKYEFISGNLSEKQLNEINKYLNGEGFKTNNIYTKVDLKDGVCVIGYDLKVHFSSESLSEILPYPEILLIMLFFVLFIFISIIVAIKFGERLKKELYPIKKSTEHIMKQDLDFEIVPTNIKEFNDVLTSISNMKSELKESLETQWREEQKKKEQIAALAHDIKTPLTIIKGNSELLLESESIKEDEEYIKYIIKNADKIEKYIYLLMDLSKAESEIDYVMEYIVFSEFLKEVTDETNMLCKSKNIKTSMKAKNSPKVFYANRDLLMRALINIITNAIDYSPINGEIEVSVYFNSSRLIFTVKDCGIGFTKQGLKNATNQFYMEQSERKVGKHYGMGLYIVQTIAKNHGGEVVLKNREGVQGAEVSLSILVGVKL